MKKPSTESYGLPDNAIDELDEKLDTALSEIEELKKDKARLDWLEEKQVPLYIVTIEKRRWLTTTCPKSELHTEFRGWSTGIQFDEVDTPREAIDLGMKGE